MNITDIEKYLNSFRRLYFSGKYNTEKGDSILKRKAKVLKLNEDECNEAIKELLEKYVEFIEFLKDIYDGQELLESEIEEINEFKKDLELNDEETENLIKMVISDYEVINNKDSQKNEHKSTSVTESILLTDSNIQEKEKLEEESIVADSNEELYINIPNTEIILKYSEQRLNEKFYYIYNAYARKAKENFFKSFFQLSSPSEFNGNNLMKIFYESFDDFFEVTHDYIIRNTNYDTCTKESLYDFLGIDKLITLADECEKIIYEINFEVMKDKENRKYRKGSSTTIGVGDIGFMAAVGVFSAVGKACGSISDSIANDRLKSQLNNRAVKLFKSISSAIEEVFDEGISVLFNTIGIYVNLRNYKDIRNDEVDSYAILKNFSYLKEDDLEEYREKLLKSIYLNPFLSEAYFELAETTHNIEGKINILELGFEKEIYSDLQYKFREKIFQLYEELANSSTKDLIKKVDILNEGLSKENLEEIKTKYETIINRFEHEIRLKEIVNKNDLYYKEIETFKNLLEECKKDIIPFYNFFEYNNEELAEIKKIISIINEEYGQEINLNSILTIYECEKSMWIFSYSGLYIIDEFNELIQGYYYNISYTKASGVMNTYLKIKFTDQQEHEIQLCSGWSSERANQLQNFISAFRGKWKSYIDNIEDSIILDALEISQEKTDETILSILGNKDKNLIRIQHVDKVSFYRLKWKEANENGYPTENILKELDELKDRLELTEQDIKTVEQPLLKKYYLEAIESVAKEDLSINELRKKLLDLRDKFNIMDGLASEVEKEQFGKIITISNSFFTFINDLTGYYKRFEKGYFGDRLYFMEEVPKDKLKAAKNKYLRMEDDEVLLFLYDNTLFGSGAEGLAITNKYFYDYHKRRISLEDILVFSYHNDKLNVKGEEFEFPLYITNIENREEFTQLLIQVLKLYHNSIKVKDVKELGQELDEDIENDEKLYEDSNENSEYDRKREEYLISQINQLHKEIIDINDSRVGINESINDKKLKNFIKIFNNKFKVGLEESMVIGFYDDTVFGNGEKGFAVLFDGICAFMRGYKGVILFEDMISAPTFSEAFNLKIFIHTKKGKNELYCTGVKAPKKLYELILLLYEYHNNK